MKSMQDISKMNDTELNTFIVENRTAIHTARFNAATPDVKGVRAAKLNIARAETEKTTRAKNTNE